jgi:hypothetical protein
MQISVYKFEVVFFIVFSLAGNEAVEPDISALCQIFKTLFPDSNSKSTASSVFWLDNEKTREIRMCLHMRLRKCMQLELLTKCIEIYSVGSVS